MTDRDALVERLMKEYGEGKHGSSFESGVRAALRVVEQTQGSCDCSSGTRMLNHGPNCFLTGPVSSQKSRIAELEREQAEARKALGPYSKHEIGQTLKGAINNLLQVLQLAKDKATDLERENAERLAQLRYTREERDANYRLLCEANAENERLRHEAHVQAVSASDFCNQLGDAQQHVTDLKAVVQKIVAAGFDGRMTDEQFRGLATYDLRALLGEKA